MKNKLKICFENLESQTWKSSRTEKKKKVINTKPEVNKLHTPQRDEDFIEMIWTLPWKPLFGRQTPTHAPIEWYNNNPCICNAHVNQFFKIIFIFIKLSNYPLYNLIVTKKKE
jgi:hypothetical protein